MVEFTFDAMFRTTNKGLPDTANIDPYTYLSMNHFVYSLIVQIIIGLLLTGYTGMAVYRAFYKIKNEKFFPGDGPVQEEPQKEEDIKSKIENQNQQDANTNDNLIYRFDEQENQKQKDEDSKEDQQEQESEDNEIEEETVSEETTEWFLDLDHKMLFFQPFLISFIVAVNVFASNILVLILFGLALVMFFLFNIKQRCNKKAIFQVFFTIPCIAAFLMVFFENKNMST